MNTNLPAPEGAADPTIHDPRQRRAILIAVCIALMAVIASVSGLNVAQPQLAVEFDASQSTVLWIINIYTISLAALLLPTPGSPEHPVSPTALPTPPARAWPTPSRSLNEPARRRRR